MSAAEVLLQLYLLEFYTRVVGLDPLWAGAALALAVLWDAATDPAMGTISDHTRTRWGKRRPYMFAGAGSLALSIMLIFHPPDLATQSGKFAFLLLSYVLVNTSMTLIAAPHAALGGEMSFDASERTEIFGWRLLFRNGGFLLGALLPGILLASMNANETAGGETASREIATRYIAAVTAVGGLVTCVATRHLDNGSRFLERSYARGVGAKLRGFFRGLRYVVTNPVFAPLLWAFAIAQIGRTLNASLALYYYKIRLELPETAVVLYILGGFMASISASIVFWVLISRRFGKKWPAFSGALALGILTVVAYPLFPPGNLWLPLLVASGFCGFLAGAIVLFDSLVADIVDHDELQTGDHREGLYFGCWTMATKAARALGLAITGGLLHWIGYEEGAAAQAPEVGPRIALVFGPAVGVCFIAAALVFCLMPLTTERHRRVQALLARRRARRKRDDGAGAGLA